tara:strand:- start:629 stop:1108 length:480 start_codon:yes stop_codon:yes gene_type:complete
MYKYIYFSQYFIIISFLIVGCNLAPPASTEEDETTLNCNTDVCLQLELENEKEEIIIRCTNSQEISGFQFYLNNILIEAFISGRAVEEGFSITNSNITYMVIGFSLTADFIPSGEGDLLRIKYSEVESLPICLSEPVFVGTGSSTPSLTVNTGECIHFN